MKKKRLCEPFIALGIWFCVLMMIGLTNACSDKNSETHSIKISDMKLVPISGSGCRVEISLSVFDKEKNFGPHAKINWAIELVDGRYSAGETTFPEKSDAIHSKDGRHSTLKTTLSLGSPFSSCKGKSVLHISVEDNKGNKSNTLQGDIEFK